MKTFDWADFGSAQTRALYATVVLCQKARDEKGLESVEAFTRGVFERTSYDDALEEYQKSVAGDRELLVGRYFYIYDDNNRFHSYHFVIGVAYPFTNQLRVFTITKLDEFDADVVCGDVKIFDQYAAHKLDAVQTKPWHESERFRVSSSSHMDMCHPIGRLGTHEMTKQEFDDVLRKALSSFKDAYSGMRSL